MMIISLHECLIEAIVRIPALRNQIGFHHFAPLAPSIFSLFLKKEEKLLLSDEMKVVFLPTMFSARYRIIFRRSLGFHFVATCLQSTENFDYTNFVFFWVLFHQLFMRDFSVFEKKCFKCISDISCSNSKFLETLHL